MSIPQAYTNRDVSEAFQWLQTLPQPIRDEMKTMEQVVLAYMKARRQGGQPQATTPPPAPSQPENSLKAFSTELEQLEFLSQKQQKANKPLPQEPERKFDPKTAGYIQEIRESFNLSSDQEVIRMCIAIGYKKLKSII